MKKAKLKLKPSKRDKRRYFILNSDDSGKIEKVILDYLGILGFAKSNYMEIESEKISGKIVGSCVRESLENVRAALSLAGISIEKTSGTIKGLLKD